MKRIKTFLLFTMLILMAAGCDLKIGGWSDDEKKPDKKPIKIIMPVEAAQPHRGDISSYYETFTRVEAESRVDVVSEGVGRCTKLNVEEGDTVTKGKVLAELDKDEAEVALEQAKVQVDQTEAAYLRCKEGGIELYSPEATETARFNVEQAKVNFKMQEEQFKNLTILSPINGVITTRNIQEGQFVSAGAPVFSIVDPMSYILVIQPPEKLLGRLKLGQKAAITIDALPDEKFEAKIRRINPSVDPVSGTVKVVLDFQEETLKKLREAAFARVKLTLETHENALLAPKDAVVEENGRKYMFLVREAPPEEVEEPEAKNSEKIPEQNDTDSDTDTDTDSDDEPVGPRFIATRVEIQTGFEDSADVEILSGITEGDLFVTLGQHTLKDGAEVRVTTAQAEIETESAPSVEDALASAKEKRKDQEENDAKPSSRNHGH